MVSWHWPHFYQTRSAWSMDQGSNENHSPVNNFAPTVTKFCVMWEGQALSHDPTFGNCRDKTVDSRSFLSWSLIHGSSWSGLIKVGPGYVHNVALTGLEGHAPAGGPVVEIIKVLLKNGLVVHILDLLIHEAVICEESDAGTFGDLWWHIVNIDQEKQWSEDRSLWNSGENGRWLRTFSIHDDTHTVPCKEGTNPAVCATLDTIMS